MEELQSQSPTAPVIKEAEVEQLMNFPDAIREITNGKKVTKVEWRSKEFWGELKDNILKLHKDDGRYYNWIVNEGDMTGEDFFVIN